VAGIARALTRSAMAWRVQILASMMRETQQQARAATSPTVGQASVNASVGAVRCVECGEVVESRRASATMCARCVDGLPLPAHTD